MSDIIIEYDKKLNDETNPFNPWYNGWYSTDIPDHYVHAFESVTNQPSIEEFENDPELAGAVYYEIFIMENSELIEDDGGLYEYNKNTTFYRFWKWIEYAHNIRMTDKLPREKEKEFSDMIYG